MRIFDGFWGLVLLVGLSCLVAACWARLDKTHPRLSMALNIVLVLVIVGSIAALILPIFWRQP